jgi:hypothetical protein
MRHTLSWLRYAGVFALVLFGAGCSSGPKLHPVKGKVMYKNQPLSGALVTLHPKDNNDLRVERPLGLSGQDGTFTVMTGQQDGAPEGEYVVTIICSAVPQADPKKAKPLGTGEIETVDILGGAYATAANSKIIVVVKPGTNELATFDLK